MTLPDGFHWIPAHQHERGEPTALALGDYQIARMLDRLDGSWFVRLECQKPMGHRLVLRDCTSFEQGRAGTEEWARRNEERIRREVAVEVGKRRKDKC